MIVIKYYLLFQQISTRHILIRGIIITEKLSIKFHNNTDNSLIKVK